MNYHDRPEISASQLKVAHSSLSEYHRRYVLREAPPQEATSRMDLGTAVHAALLEPERFGELVVTIPRELLAKNGAESTNDAREFRREHEAAGKVVLKPDQFGAAQLIVDAVRGSVAGQWLASPGEREVPRYWVCYKTGLKLRCKPDFFSWHAGIMLDLKTTGDPTPGGYWRHADRQRAWLQAAHYLDSVAGEGRFIFVAVGSEWPHTVAVYEFDGESIDLADEVRLGLLRRIYDAQRTGDWSDEWERQINRLTYRRPYEPRGN